MGLFGASERAPVATAEVALHDGDRVTVTVWVDESDRQEAGYHAVLLFLMFYARLLFFLSYRETAEQLAGWMDEAVRTLASAPEGGPVHVSRDRTVQDSAEGEPRARWSAALTQVAPGEYRCKDVRPAEPEDPDAQAAALCLLQKLADTLPALERAYLAVAISGMHEYYREIKIWANSKSLRPAVSYGMTQARKVLELQ